MSNRVLRVLKRGCVISRIVDVFEAVNAWVRRALGNVFLTLFTPAYFGILGTGGRAHCALPKYLGVGWG